jgi:hypothetical protein
VVDADAMVIFVDNILETPKAIGPYRHNGIHQSRTLPIYPGC